MHEGLGTEGAETLRWVGAWVFMAPGDGHYPYPSSSPSRPFLTRPLRLP